MYCRVFPVFVFLSLSFSLSVHLVRIFLDKFARKFLIGDDYCAAVFLSCSKQAGVRYCPVCYLRCLRNRVRSKLVCITTSKRARSAIFSIRQKYLRARVHESIRSVPPISRVILNVISPLCEFVCRVIRFCDKLLSRSRRPNNLFPRKHVRFSR